MPDDDELLKRHDPESHMYDTRILGTYCGAVYDMLSIYLHLSERLTTCYTIFHNMCPVFLFHHEDAVSLVPAPNRSDILITWHRSIFRGI